MLCGVVWVGVGGGAGYVVKVKEEVPPLKV